MLIFIVEISTLQSLVFTNVWMEVTVLAKGGLLCIAVQQGVQELFMFTLCKIMKNQKFN